MNDTTDTRFGVLRHAPTLWNRQKRIQGLLDIRLSPEGKQMARQWGRKLSAISWDGILSSSSIRAVETAKLINACLNIPLVLDDRLREQDWGRWSGNTMARIQATEPELLERQVTSGWEFHPPGGESRNSVWQRSHEALSEAAFRFKSRRILLVTHEGVLRCLIYRIRSRRFLPSEPELIRPFHLHWLVHYQNAFYAQINALSLV